MGGLLLMLDFNVTFSSHCPLPFSLNPFFLLLILNVLNINLEHDEHVMSLNELSPTLKSYLLIVPIQAKNQVQDL